MPRRCEHLRERDSMRRSMTREDEASLTIDLRRAWLALDEGQEDPIAVFHELVRGVGDSLKHGLGLNRNGNSRFDRDEFERCVYVDIREARAWQAKAWMEAKEDL